MESKLFQGVVTVVAVMLLSAGCATSGDKNSNEGSSTETTNKPSQTSEKQATKSTTRPKRTVTVTAEATDSSSRSDPSAISSGSPAAEGQSPQKDGASWGNETTSLKTPSFPVTEFRQVKDSTKSFSVVVPSWMLDNGFRGQKGVYGAKDVSLLLRVVDATHETREAEFDDYMKWFVDFLNREITSQEVTERGFAIQAENGASIMDMVAVLEDGKVYAAFWEYSESIKPDMAPIVARSHESLTTR